MASMVLGSVASLLRGGSKLRIAEVVRNSIWNGVSSLLENYPALPRTHTQITPTTMKPHLEVPLSDMVWWYNYFTNDTKAQQTENLFVHRSTLLPLRLYLTAVVQPIQQGLSQTQVWRYFFLRKESSAVHSVDKLALWSLCYCCIYTLIYNHTYCMLYILCYIDLSFADHIAEGRTAATPCYWLGCRNFCHVVTPGFQLVKCGSSVNTKVIDGGCAKERSLTSLQVLQCSFWCCDRALDMCYFEKHRHQIQWLRGKAAFSNPRVVRQAGLLDTGTDTEGTDTVWIRANYWRHRIIGSSREKLF